MTRAVHDLFEELYLTQFDRLARRAGRNVGDTIEGEDIVARAFVDLWELILQGFNGDLAARLNQRIQSRCADYWKKHRSKLGGLQPQLVRLETEEDERELPVLWTNALPTPETLRFTQSFDAAIRELPEDERGAFILTELRGLTVREAATVAHVPKTTLARHAEAARNLLREEIDR